MSWAGQEHGLQVETPTAGTNTSTQTCASTSEKNKLKTHRCRIEQEGKGQVHLVAVLRHPRHHHIRVQLTLDSQRSLIHPRDGLFVTGQRGWRVIREEILFTSLNSQRICSNIHIAIYCDYTSCWYRTFSVMCTQRSLVL